MTYKLTYFKPSGKYYSEGALEVDHGEFYAAIATARILAKQRRLPGLIKGHSSYTVVLTDWQGLPHIVCVAEDINDNQYEATS